MRSAAMRLRFTDWGSTGTPGVIPSASWNDTIPWITAEETTALSKMFRTWANAGKGYQLRVQAHR